MARVYIPQPTNLVGMVQGIQQLKESQENLDLLGRNLEEKAAALANQRRQQRADNLFKLLQVKGQSRKSLQGILDEFTEILGYPRLELDEGGELIKKLQGVQKAAEKDPTGDYSSAIQTLVNEHGHEETALKQIDLLKKNIESERGKTVGQFFSLLGASGGILPGQEDALINAFAESGGTAAIRQGAASILKQRKDLLEKPEREATQTIRKIGPDSKVHVFQYNPDTNRYDIDAGLAATPGGGGRPESAYKAWEGVIHTRMNQMWRKYNLTGSEIQQLQAGGDQLQGLLSAFLAKKGLTPEATQKALIELQGLEKIRDQGYEDLEESRSPYARLKKKPPIVVPSDVNRAAKSPDRAEELKQRATIALPDTIKKVSEAISYLMKTHGMTEEEAKDWLRSQK